RRRHTRWPRDWSSDVCSSDLGSPVMYGYPAAACNTAVLGCSGTGPNSGVVLDSRVQTLTQSLSDCVVNVTVSGVAGTGTCDFTSTIQLILQTTSAHGYNFIFPNVGEIGRASCRERG